MTIWDTIYHVLSIIIRASAVIFVIVQMLKCQCYVIHEMEHLLRTKAPHREIAWLVFKDAALMVMIVIVLCFFLRLWGTTV